VIVVDSSIWIDYFASRERPAGRRLEQLLDDGETPHLLEIIVTEVLQGFRSDRQFELARGALGRLPRIRLSMATWVGAAKLFRRLRARGLTVRSTIDCVIAQACIESGASLMTADREFDDLARHSKLKLV
jgi:predicted nucleic acid-binding protein